MYRIVFVCHGNICRSPAAEYLAKEEIAKRGLTGQIEVVSRATSLEEIGNDIYPPMKAELRRRGVPFSRHYASRITTEDYAQADAIYYMDENNRRYLGRLLNDSRGICFPITKYVSDFDEIEDPWYTDRFSYVAEQIKRCVEAILDHAEIK